MRDTSCCLFLTKQADANEALNINTPYFEQMVSRVYSAVLQL